MIHSFSTVILLLQFCVRVHLLFIASVDSGHGGQVKDETGTQCDGMDEGTQWAILVHLYNLLVNLFLFCRNFQLYFRSIFNQLAISLIKCVATPTSISRNLYPNYLIQDLYTALVAPLPNGCRLTVRFSSFLGRP